MNNKLIMSFFIALSISYAELITVDGDISAIRGAFSASDAGGDGSFSYNSSTGAFTYTIADDGSESN